MGRAKKPNPDYCAIQPYRPPKLDNTIKKTLAGWLGIDAEAMSETQAEVEKLLGFYFAEKLILDQKPSPASIRRELSAILAQIDGLERHLEQMTSATRSAIPAYGSVGDFSNKLVIFHSAILQAERENRGESRGGSLRQHARNNLIKHLETLFNKVSRNADLCAKIDFITEVLEAFDIPAPLGRDMDVILRR